MVSGHAVYDCYDCWVKKAEKEGILKSIYKFFAKSGHSTLNELISVEPVSSMIRYVVENAFKSCTIYCDSGYLLL